MIVVIDNYDSFTYNLVQYFGEMGEKLQVFRHDQVAVANLERISPEMIVISPGPCTPHEAGISLDVVRCFAGRIPILGVCLGHQVIGQAFGGRVIQGDRLMHGKTSPVYHDGKTIFNHIPSPFEAARYHSLMIDEKTLPACFEVSAWTKEGELMGIRHKQFAIEGVQFHPESIMTSYGKQILDNFRRSHAMSND